MLSRIVLRFGPDVASPPLDFAPGAITIFVGPNNAGKSLALREIERFAIQARNYEQGYRIVERLEFEPWSREDVERILETRRVHPPHGNETSWTIAQMTPRSGAHLRPVDPNMTIEQAIAGGEDQRLFLASLLTAHLDGQTRVILLQEQQAGDLLGPATNILHALAKDQHRRSRVRQLVHEAFGRYFVVDPTNLGKLRARLSAREPTEVAEEMGLDERAMNFHRAAPLFDEFSDGVRAYSGVLAVALAGDFRLILVDEPEAFLHPPLTRKLARQLSQFAVGSGGHAIVATHSADFVMGAVESGRPVDVVRLTYQPKRTASLLTASMLRAITQDPLLRSTKLLSALFFDGAIVVEGDRDRAFYGEINARLAADGSGGDDNLLFLSSYNWQSAYRMVTPLRKMGIPAAALVDFDAIQQPEFKELLRACGLTEEATGRIGRVRTRIADAYNAAGLKLREGIAAVPDESIQRMCHELVFELNQYGLFLVPVGDVERWLRELNLEARKKRWLVAMLERLGSDPAANDYVRPSSGDVWEFVRLIVSWLNNPNRMGMVP